MYEVSSLAEEDLADNKQEDKKEEDLANNKQEDRKEDAEKKPTISTRNKSNRLFINVKTTTCYSMGKQIYP